MMMTIEGIGLIITDMEKKPYEAPQDFLDIDNTNAPVFEINGFSKPESREWHRVNSNEHSFAHDQVKRAFDAGMFDKKTKTKSE